MSSDLGDLLGQCQEALLRGDFEALAVLQLQLEEAGLPEEAAETRALQEIAGRNMELANMAIRGVKAAQRRIDEITRARQSRTYGSDGAIDRIDDGGQIPLRRA